jgi:hypothetical protein
MLYDSGMRSHLRSIFIATALAAVGPALAQAHFILMEPASWIVENRLGDPQKLGPCGGTSADAGTPTNIAGHARGSQKIHLKVQETIFHPGHYRVALAVNSRDELPPDPTAVTRDSERGPWSVSAPIQSPVRAPVLADGLFVHTIKAAEPFETDIELPNITCKKCTLQIVEFMAEHGVNRDGGFYYHHCADLQIDADPARPIDAGWPAAR